MFQETVSQETVSQETMTYTTGEHELALTPPGVLANMPAQEVMGIGGPAEEWTEAELVERFRESGERRWFAQLYQRTRRRVFVACLRRVREPSRAEDLCHDAFVRAFHGFERFEGTAFCAWVCRIAVNLALNDLRHREVAARLAPEAVAPGTEERPDRRAVAREQLGTALEILDRLESHQRRVFLLRHLDGLSYVEIAERTGYDRGQVRSYLQNARRNFRIEWDRRTQREVTDG